MEIVQLEGDKKITRSIDIYNLDAAIAVGYRVNSIKATHYVTHGMYIQRKCSIF